jgi:hypothetical protein
MRLQIFRLLALRYKQSMPFKNNQQEISELGPLEQWIGYLISHRKIENKNLFYGSIDVE